VKKPPVIAVELPLPPSPPPALVADVPMPVALKPEASAPPKVEPVIRRAILASQEIDKPSQFDLPPKEMATHLPAPLPAPATPSTPEPVVAATEPPKTPLNPPAAAPPAQPAEVATLEEVTIRHAIVLTPEEINETLRAQTQARKRTSKRR